MAGENILTLEEAKIFCKVTMQKNFRDREMSSIIDDVTADIQIELNRNLFTADYEEKIDIESPYQKTILVKNYPIQSITSLYDYNTLLVEDTNYCVDYETGIIERIDVYYFTQGSDKVTVSYAAGYDEGDVPNGIKSIAKHWVFKRFYDRSFDIDDAIRRKLTKHQRPVIK